MKWLVNEGDAEVGGRARVVPKDTTSRAELARRRTAAARRSGRYIRRSARREECIEFIGAFAPRVMAGPMLEFGSGAGGAAAGDVGAEVYISTSVGLG